jgi:hypothetical protein
MSVFVGIAGLPHRFAAASHKPADSHSRHAQQIGSIGRRLHLDIDQRHEMPA